MHITFQVTQYYVHHYGWHIGFGIPKFSPHHTNKNLEIASHVKMVLGISLYLFVLAILELE